MSTPTFVLVGNAQAGTISTLSFDGEALQVVAESAIGKGCSTFAVDSGRDLVYSAVKAPIPAIVTLSFNRRTGELNEQARYEVADSLAYLSLTRDGSVLLGASYGGGWGAAWPVSGGRLGESASRVEHANLHAVITDAAGDYAYFVSLGDDLIAQVKLAADASFASLQPSIVSVPKGAGARHLVLSGDERSAYLVTEFTGEAIRFDRDVRTGALSMAEAVPAYDADKGLKKSRFGAPPLEEHLIWGADLHLVADGRFLVCSERTISTLGVVAVGDDGRLGELISLTETEEQPRGFNVTPDGNHLVVVGEKSGHASLYRVGDEGGLELLSRVETGAGPNWVRFI